MRKEFSAWMEKLASLREDAVFLTGDLGFAALEGPAKAFGQRFVNVGVAEQNMVSLAAGLAHQGLLPFCYSIAPFAVFRPAEQLRLDVGIHNMNVKVVGNGGGYGYGIMGATHHAIEDLALMSTFPNFRSFVPFSNEDVETVCEQMIEYRGPSYLRLGFGSSAELCKEKTGYAPIRRLRRGNRATLIAVGPVVLNALRAIQHSSLDCDVFIVSELPLFELPDDLIESIKRTKSLFVLEEHVARGGLGEHLALQLMSSGLSPRVSHRCAVGYPDGLYGSQAYHQKMSGLDERSLKDWISG